MPLAQTEAKSPPVTRFRENKTQTVKTSKRADLPTLSDLGYAKRGRATELLLKTIIKSMDEVEKDKFCF